jgi:hypothetical protein
MTPLKPMRKTAFAFVWGVLAWGGGTALLVTLWDRKTDGYVRPGEVVARFVIFMSLGYFFGLRLWDGFGAAGRIKDMTRSQIIVRAVILVGLVLFLVYVPRFLNRHFPPPISH